MGASAALGLVFFFQAEDGIRDLTVTGVQTCALPISHRGGAAPREAVRAFAARSAALERRRVSKGFAPIGTILPIGPGRDTLGAHALQQIGRASCRERV